MFHRIHSVRAPFRREIALFSDGAIPFPLVSLPLLIGLLFGSVVGLFSVLPSEFSSFFSVFPDGALSVGFPDALWHSSRLILISLLLATSFIGFLFIPALSAFHGFLLGSSVAGSFQTDGLHGLLVAAFTVGLPALLGLTAFLLASSDAAACSIRLLRCFSRGENRPFVSPERFPRHLSAVFLLCFFEAFYSAFLLPAITGLFL